jgi:Alpha-L-arabinofuranosidase B (ABFB) domain
MSNGNVSFRSVNYGTRYIRHQNFLAELQEIADADDLAKHDASFVFHPGLASEFANGIGSYEAVNFPNFFLRHQDFRLKLQERPGDGDPAQGQFDLDATFFIVPGKVQASPLFGGDIISLQSVNFSSMYLRHQDFHLFLTEISTDLDFLDATFEVQNSFV